MSVEIVEIGFDNPLTQDLVNILYEAFKCKEKITLKKARAKLYEQHQQNGFTFAVRLCDETTSNKNKYIGIGTVFLLDKLIHGGTKMALIEDVAIHKDYRGYGYGSILINKLEEFSTLEKAYKCVLYCSQDNFKFYQKCGFRGSCNLMRKDLS